MASSSGRKTSIQVSDGDHSNRTQAAPLNFFTKRCSLMVALIMTHTFLLGIWGFDDISILEELLTPGNSKALRGRPIKEQSSLRTKEMSE